MLHMLNVFISLPWEEAVWFSYFHGKTTFRSGLSGVWTYCIKISCLSAPLGHSYPMAFAKKPTFKVFSINLVNWHRARSFKHEKYEKNRHTTRWIYSIPASAICPTGAGCCANKYIAQVTGVCYSHEIRRYRIFTMGDHWWSFAHYAEMGDT